MNQQFQAHPIDRDWARAAYPLVYMHDASISQEKWLRFAGRYEGIASDTSGLMVIRDSRGIIHALFSYRTDLDLHLRKRLCIGNLVVAHIPGSQIDEAVAECSGNLAAALACQTILIEQPFNPRRLPPQCPTARLIQQWPRLLPNSRPH